MKYVEAVISEELRKFQELYEDVQRRGRMIDEEYHKAVAALDKESAVISERMSELYSVLKLLEVPAEDNDESAEETDQTRRRRYSDDEILQLVSLKENGKSYTEIAKILGRTRGSLSGKLHEFKYGKQTKKVIKRATRKRVTLREKQEIKACYRKGMGISETAKHLGRGVRTISRIYSQLRKSL